jgi:type IV fimbrial biogenesis protein FimT
MTQRSKSGGFTLPELVITMGIIAIVLTTAVPSVSSMIKDNRLANQLNSVVIHLHMARAEAAKREVRVIMCRSADPNAVNPTCGGSTGVWTQGYLVFADDGNYSNNVYNAGSDTLLYRGQPAASGVKRRTNGTWNENLEFNPDGSTNESGTLAIMALCDDRRSDNGRQIQVGPNGMPKLFSENISDCDDPQSIP